MFTGLVLLDGGFPEQAGEALPRLDALVTPAVPETPHPGRRQYWSRRRLAHGRRGLAPGGAGRCGRIPASPEGPRPAQRVAVDPGGRPSAADAAVRRPEWMAAYTAYSMLGQPAVKRFMAGVGAAQGPVACTRWT